MLRKVKSELANGWDKVMSWLGNGYITLWPKLYLVIGAVVEFYYW